MFDPNPQSIGFHLKDLERQVKPRMRDYREPGARSNTKLHLTIAATALLASTLLAASAVQAETKINALCGANHVNEAASGDVVANPDGYYVRSLQIQLSHGDARIVHAVGDEFHLCTRTAALPEMDAYKAKLLMEERRPKYLFVPVCPPKAKASS